MYGKTFSILQEISLQQFGKAYAETHAAQHTQAAFRDAKQAAHEKLTSACWDAAHKTHVRQ